MAASYIYHEQRRFEREGIPRKLKCAILFTGWPVVGDNGWPVFADQTEERIDIPSVHVVGANGESAACAVATAVNADRRADPFLHGALTMYNMCDEEKALLFDTGKGHTLPRDGAVLPELAEAIRNMVKMARESQ